MAKFIIDREYNGNCIIQFKRNHMLYIIFTKTKNEYIIEQIKNDIEGDIITGKIDQLAPSSFNKEAVAVKKKPGNARRGKHSIQIVCAVKGEPFHENNMSS